MWNNHFPTISWYSVEVMWNSIIITILITSDVLQVSSFKHSISQSFFFIDFCLQIRNNYERFIYLHICIYQYVLINLKRKPQCSLPNLPPHCTCKSYIYCKNSPFGHSLESISMKVCQIVHKMWRASLWHLTAFCKVVTKLQWIS